MAVLNMRIANAAGRDATILLTRVRPPPAPKLGLPGKEVRFQRYLACHADGLHDAMQARLGQEYGQALIDGDPEIDIESVGRALPRSSVVYLSADGEALYASPKEVEVIIDPDGSERERRDPQELASNVNDDAAPVRWTGRKMSKNEAAHRFVFQRSVQLRHVDGLTYDFLYGMARDLAEEDAVVLLGGGAKGNEPLIFYANGSPYRGFLEGRVDQERYQLLLRLSAMELKRPATAEGAA
jgi:hypothetical protein